MFLWQLNTASLKKRFFFWNFWFFVFSNRAEWCWNIRCSPQDEISSEHFKSDEKMQKTWKNRFFHFFFIIERVFVKGIQRKNKKNENNIRIDSYS